MTVAMINLTKEKLCFAAWSILHSFFVSDMQYSLQSLTTSVPKQPKPIFHEETLQRLSPRHLVAVC